MSDMNKKVMIGCPVRNRAWILPRYLDSLQKLQYPEEYIEYCFIINDSTDETLQILTRFAQEQSSRVRLVTVNLGPARGHLRGEYSFSRLACLRNRLLDEFLRSSCDYLFSLDSDILVSPFALTCLLEARCEIISALVCNGHEVGDSNLFNILRWNEQGQLLHLKEFPRNRIFPVDCTGAAYLISRRVIESCGVRYSAQWGAEDIGFCQGAREKGIKIYCDSRIECEHVMHG